MAETTVWGIHAGRTGDADTLFLKASVVALGWPRMGNLSAFKDDRQQFRNRAQECFPDWKKGKIANAAGQLYRFMHELAEGDLIAYPSKRDRHVHVGRVVSDYQFDPSPDASYPHFRKVEWISSQPRTAFSQGALYEIGSALSFFQVKSYADEFIAVAEGGLPDSNETDAESPGLDSEDIEDQTRDFVLKQLSKNLKGLPLEEFIQHLMEKMGYRARLSRMNEPSVDLVAHKDDLGFEPPLIKVQVKSGGGKVGDKDVSALYGKVEPGEFGLLVTLGEFTPPAITFANSKSNLRLLAGAELVDLIFEYYDRFDSRYKGIIPLKKVYVPQQLDD